MPCSKVYLTRKRGTITHAVLTVASSATSSKSVFAFDEQPACTEGTCGHSTLVQRNWVKTVQNDRKYMHPSTILPVQNDSPHDDYHDVIWHAKEEMVGIPPK